MILEALKDVRKDELFNVILSRKFEGRILDAELPWASKRRLCECRGTSYQQSKCAASIRPAGSRPPRRLTLSDRILLSRWPTEKVEELLGRSLIPHFPFEGSEMRIEHVKLGVRGVMEWIVMPFKILSGMYSLWNGSTS